MVVCVVPSLLFHSQIGRKQGPELNSCISICNLLLVTLNLRSKVLSLPLKQAIIRQIKSKSNQPHQRDNGNIRHGQTNYLVHCEEKKNWKEYTGELCSTKKTSVADFRRSLSLARKNHLARLTTPPRGVSVSELTIKRRFCQIKYRRVYYKSKTIGKP